MTPEQQALADKLTNLQRIKYGFVVDMKGVKNAVQS